MLSQKRLVDKMIEAYVAWREACLIVSDAYEAWTRESSFWASLAFEDYSAALDREEHAAELYAGLVQRVARLARRDHRRVSPAPGLRDGRTVVRTRAAVRDRRRISVCDNELQSARALRLVLVTAGFRVDMTDRAEGALQHASLAVPDAAIVELALPDGDGVELCRRLRQWTRCR